MTLLELLTELEQKSKAPRREFFASMPLDYSDIGYISDESFVVSKGDLKFDYFKVQELSSVPTDKLIAACRELVEKLDSMSHVADDASAGGLPFPKKTDDAGNEDLNYTIQELENVFTGISIGLRQALTTAEKILKGEM